MIAKANSNYSPQSSGTVKEKTGAAGITGKTAEVSVYKGADSIVRSDVVSISEDGNIDLNMFNYLDGGGDASKALSTGAEKEKPFAPKPNFVGMGVTRYNQMKSEIEQNFADDPEAKDRYLRELDKALADYISLQAKIAEALAGKADKVKKEVLEGEAGNAVETESAELKELKVLYNAGSNEVKAIIDKVLGDTQSNLPEEMSKAIDDYFIEVYKKKMEVPKKRNVFNQEVKENPFTKEIWNNVRSHIDSED